MDAFGDLLRGVRAQGSLFGTSILTPPWSLQFVDGAPLTLCTVLSGGGWIVPERRPPERLGIGETVIVRGPAPFLFVDEVGTRAEPVACGALCSTPEQDGTVYRLGWHDAGVGGEDTTTLVVGAYPVRGEISRRLLDALPAVLRVGSGSGRDPVWDHLAAEVAADTPGQQVVLDRLLDWMLVCALREYFDRPGGTPPGWYSGGRDPVVGGALRLLHGEPAAPWTVASLADRTGVSRATLAKRFTELVGEPPLTYLTRWRMTLAADLLTERETVTVAEVARAVGYSDAFAFSAAFKRVRGISPSAFRRAATAPAQPRAARQGEVAPRASRLLPSCVDDRTEPGRDGHVVEPALVVGGAAAADDNSASAFR